MSSQHTLFGPSRKGNYLLKSIPSRRKLREPSTRTATTYLLGSTGCIGLGDTEVRVLRVRPTPRKYCDTITRYITLVSRTLFLPRFLLKNRLVLVQFGKFTSATFPAVAIGPFLYSNSRAIYIYIGSAPSFDSEPWTRLSPLLRPPGMRTDAPKTHRTTSKLWVIN